MEKDVKARHLEALQIASSSSVFVGRVSLPGKPIPSFTHRHTPSRQAPGTARYNGTSSATTFLAPLLLHRSKQWRGKDMAAQPAEQMRNRDQELAITGSEPVTSAMSWVIRVVSKPGFSLSTSSEKSR